MNDKEEQLVYLIQERDVSSIQVLSGRLKLNEDEVVSLIKRLQNSGELRGTLTPDHQRFFKSDARPSAAPSVPREEKPPDFLQFNPRPGQYVAILGFAILATGVGIMFSAGTNLEQENLGTVIMLFGTAIMLSGCYYLGRRKTP